MGLYRNAVNVRRVISGAEHPTGTLSRLFREDTTSRKMFWGERSRPVSESIQTIAGAVKKMGKPARGRG